MPFHRKTIAAWVCLATCTLAAEPKLLDDQFELPDGFHIYRAAPPELTGGSFDLTFDGEGRLLVADGNAVRRLGDRDKNGVYDSYVTIADGPPVAGRGPQGLLVYGDNLYSVSGDGVQLFSGYNTGGKLKHERRLGEAFHTGGDHAAHTVLRGLDGYLYLVTGDGAGIGGRKHITEERSPAREERAASVFRFDPTGTKWECVGSGGRNPPSLGMNYLGELFSFDSDMEFHVDVPFYRPVRLNHWATGGDQGWQQVGAFPSYFIDNLPGVLEVGRGSPNWGVFYEHTQLPLRYRDAFIVCDCRWKSATSGSYATSGRLVVFHLERDGGTWRADMSELAKANAAARDADGNAINFALVDVDVAPDGSLMLTDHNQGVWRIFYDSSERPTIPPVVPSHVPAMEQTDLLKTLLTLPQPAAEWSRLREETLKRAATFNVGDALQDAAADDALPSRQRLRAIRLLAPGFDQLPASFIARLSKQADSEIRAQAAWLAGMRRRSGELGVLLRLIDDRDPFVRRRAAEALSRFASPDSCTKLTARLGDPDRFVRYAAMIALSHRPTGEFFGAASDFQPPQVLMRLLVAAHLRKERPSTQDVLNVIPQLLTSSSLSIEDQRDLLRVLSLYRKEIESRTDVLEAVADYVLTDFPHSDSDVRWEQVRLLGEFEIQEAFPRLVDQLHSEKNRVAQFHIASAIAELPKPADGWDHECDVRLGDWLMSTQTGWFSEFGGKGLQFPGFWATVLNKLAGHHVGMLSDRLERLDPNGQLAPIVFSKLRTASNADDVLIDLYRRNRDVGSRRSILGLLQGIDSADAVDFMTSEYAKAKDPLLRKTLLVALGASGHASGHSEMFLGALFEFDDADASEAIINGLVVHDKRLKRYRLVTPPAVAGHQGEQAVCFRLLELMERHPKRVARIGQAMAVLTGHQPLDLRSPPRCIWSSKEQSSGDRAWFAKSFNVSGGVERGEMMITCDNEFIAYINGKRVSASTTWERPRRVDIRGALRAGENLIAIEGSNQGGPAGLIASLSWTTTNGDEGRVVTDPTWRVTNQPPAHWWIHGTLKGSWVPSTDVSGPTGNAVEAFSAFAGGNVESDGMFIQEYWHKWYLQRYEEAFVARFASDMERPDQVVHQLIAGMDNIHGDAERGRALYLKAGCFACHGGIGSQQTTIFGPALGGVTLRLKRRELADSIVFPSKQVVERFKASVLTTTDGRQLSGFITEQSDEFVSITDLQSKVTRLPRARVDSIEAQEKSLMPDGLLNGFTDEEIQDLIAFLAALRG